MLLVKNIKNMIEYDNDAKTVANVTFFQARKHAWCFQTDLFVIFFLHLPQVHVPFNLETHNTTSYNPKRQQKS